MTSIDVSAVRRAHCFGIGGTGMSAIARMLRAGGALVSGSDAADSPSVDALRRLGIEVSIGQRIEDVPHGCDLVVYSAALSVAEPAFVEALSSLPCPALSYAEVLGILSVKYRTIAVSGTHGKTTTTAMVAKILMDAGLDPTVLVGGTILETGSNFVAGGGEWLVVEADEYRRNFMPLSPSILVITNIDADHLDYYEDLADIQSAFRDLAAKLPSDGAMITDLSKENVLPVVESSAVTVIDYGSVDSAGLSLPFPGRHNIENAKAAIAVASLLGVPEEASRKSLASFKGTGRRFEYKGRTKSGALVYDDYAHNPQKLEAAIRGAKEAFPDKKVMVVFQPHLYSRTKALLHEFAHAIAIADRCVVIDIFPAREPFDPSISSEDIVREASLFNKDISYAPGIPDAVAVAGAVPGDTVVLTVGAGDIYRLAEILVAEGSL